MAKELLVVNIYETRGRNAISIGEVGIKQLSQITKLDFLGSFINGGKRGVFYTVTFLDRKKYIIDEIDYESILKNTSNISVLSYGISNGFGFERGSTIVVKDSVYYYQLYPKVKFVNSKVNEKNLYGIFNSEGLQIVIVDENGKNSIFDLEPTTTTTTEPITTTTTSIFIPPPPKDPK